MALSTAELLRLYRSGQTLQRPMSSQSTAQISPPPAPSTSSWEEQQKEDEDEKKDKKPDIKRLEQGTQYAVKYQKVENSRLIKVSFDLCTNDDDHEAAGPSSKRMKIDDAEDEMHFALKEGTDTPEIPEMSVYGKYSFDIAPQDLPIKLKRDEIMSQINKNMFIVLTANTGTGKSTQIPQYILEDARKNRQRCNIVVTQPRRIAAISVAKRVALERECECGTLVGYQVGSEKKVDEKANSDTRILFCTTGVLLQKLVNEKSLKNYTHVIVDEIHERDINIDMLLIVLRRLVATKNPQVKIILMSATMNSEKLANYFITYKPYEKELQSSPAPVLDLNIDRPYQIDYKYLDDLEEQLGRTADLVNPDEPGVSDQLYSYAARCMVEMIDESRLKDIRPSFVVFLPGLYEIERFKSTLYSYGEKFNIEEFKISILHSQISEDYRMCDDNVDNRIILSTNIAESSVTLPGIRYVIDFCLTKYKETDAASNATRLKLDWASANSLHQRAGRVGRMAEGRVVRLITKAHFNLLPQEVKPEIKRISLEFAVLKTKQLDLGRPAAVLALALDPPDKKYINDAIIYLKEIGAFTRFGADKKFSSKDGELTPLGQIMSILPVDVRIAKLIVIGYTFRCLNECIVMGVGMNYRSIFTLVKADAKQKIEEYNQKLEFSCGSASDPITLLNAYNKWCDMMEKTDGMQDRLRRENVRQTWCRKQFLSHRNLRDMHREIEEIQHRLKRQQFDINDNFPFNDEKKLAVLKMCLAGAFYPNFFAFGGNPPTHEEFKSMKGLDPCKVVAFKGIRNQNIMKLYKEQIANDLYDMGITDDSGSIKIHQHLNSQRIFVEFNSLKNEEIKSVPGMVRPEVYRALKLRKLDHDITIRVIKDEPAERAAAIRYHFGYNDMRTNHFNYEVKRIKNLDKCIYPQKMHERGEIIHIIDCSKFYFQPAAGRVNLNELTENIEECYRHVQEHPNIRQGSLALVKFEGHVRRVKVLDLPDTEVRDSKYEVHLIDLGRTVDVDLEDFREMDGADEEETESLTKKIFELPPQCYECRLSAVIPSPIRCANGWSEESKRHFVNFVKDKRHSIRIRSFYELVASVEVNVEDGNVFSQSLNSDLVLKGFALASDDSYMQQQEQVKRESLMDGETVKCDDYEDIFAEEPMFTPPEMLYNHRVTLVGPISEIECTTVDKLAAFDGTKLCQIESSSVNSVLVDPYPFDSTPKIIVAASLVEKENSMQLCNTTMLPHCHGMPTLAALIFAPLSEIRLTPRTNRVASILCGLGGTLQKGNKMKSIFGEHDVLVRNDIALDCNDVDKINTLRAQMSSLLRDRLNMNKQFCAELRDRICSTLLDILSEKRKLIPAIVTHDSDLDRHWKIVHEIEPEHDILYPAHSLPSMTPLDETIREKLRRNARDELQAFLSGRSRKYECKLCKNKEFDSVEEFKIHQLTNLHNDRLCQLRDEQTPM